jgi:hypothetical protein
LTEFLSHLLNHIVFFATVDGDTTKPLHNGAEGSAGKQSMFSHPVDIQPQDEGDYHHGWKVPIAGMWHRDQYAFFMLGLFTQYFPPQQTRGELEKRPEEKADERTLENRIFLH